MISVYRQVVFSPAVMVCLLLALSGIAHCKLDTEAAETLIRRVVPEHAAQITVEEMPQVDGKDVFEIESVGDRLVLRGPSGICIGSALYYYLNNYCSAQVTWNGTNLNLPETLPKVPEKVTRNTPYDYRYYLNYVTYNYTMPWWDWERWEKEIDWMALHGVNMPLSVLGQNSVWQRVYNELGFSNEELESFFSGPAYTGFNWMGVLDGWGGPMPQSMIDAHEELQKKILQRQRELGMIPVLPAFTGHVPPGFEEKFPSSKVNQVDWTGFPPTNLLDPNDPMFITIGEAFIKEQTRTYGTDHFYSADTFIEMIPPSDDAGYLDAMGKNTYQSMAKGDPKAVWVMQGWMFQYLSKFWKNPQIEALLGSVPDGNMIILDLYSESKPVWDRTEGYFGKPWLWCIVHNFGGNISMTGRMKQIATGPAEARESTVSKSMRGIGVATEALEQNPVVYELMTANTWRDTPIDLDEWLKSYVRQRYGRHNPNADKAWQILKSTVYDATTASGGPESIITGRPTLADRARWTRTQLHYEPIELLKAWKLLLEAAPELKNSEGYQYDLVDVTRQVLVNYANVVQQRYSSAVKENRKQQRERHSQEFLEIIDDTDKLLASHRDFLLGIWLEQAKSWGANSHEEQLMEINARNILTTWGDKHSTLHEYANRQWSGLLSAFYKPRWEQFFDYVKSREDAGGELDEKPFQESIKTWEWGWVHSNELHKVEPEGDPVEACLSAYQKYFDTISEAY